MLLLGSSFYATAHLLGFENYTEKQGLSNNVIMDLHEDRRGFLWVATINGLNRFDGIKFKKFYFDENNIQSLPSSRVSSLIEDRKGKIWIGTVNGVACYNPETEVITRIPVEFEKNFREVLDIYCDRKDRIWICTEAGVYLINQGGKRLGYWTGDGRADSMPYSGTYKTEEDPWGNIWVLSKCGLAKYLEKEKQFKVYSTYKSTILYPPQTCTAPMAVWFPNKDEIICGSWASGILRFNRNTGVYTNHLHSPEFKGQGAFNVITGLAWFDQKLYVGSHDKGLGWYDTLSRTFTYLRDLQLEGFNLPTMQTPRLCANANVLWAGTTDGLYKLDLRTQRAQMFRFNEIRKGDCLPDIHHVAAMGKGKDSLSIASWTCGMWWFEPKTGKLSPAGVESPRLAGSSHNVDFWMSYEDRRGCRWYASSHGLFRVEGSKIQLITTVATEKGLPRENYFTKVVEDLEGNIWAGSLDGILFFKDGGRTYLKMRIDSLIPDAIGIVSNRMLDIDADLEGNLWFSCEAIKNSPYSGLICYERKTKKWKWFSQDPKFATEHFLPGHKWFDLLIDAKNRFWVASSSGIRVYSGIDFRLIKHLTTSGGLSSDQVHALSEDTEGNIWTHYEGAFETDAISIRDFRIRKFGEKEGLPKALFTGIQTGPEGAVYFEFNRNWFGIYRTVDERAYNSTHQAYITSLVIDGIPQVPGPVIQVGADQKVIELEFSPMNMLRPDLQKFRIRIQAPDQELTYVPEGNKVVLSSLSPGTYQLYLSHETADILQPQKQLLITLHIPPKWYQSVWFKLMGILLLLTLTGLLVFYFTRRAAQRNQLKIEKEREMEQLKMKALRAQMNPHFIFNALNSINRYIWNNKPEEASSYISRFARLTRKILDHSRQDWISLKEDLEALDLYIQLESGRFGNRLKYEIKVEEGIDQEELLIPPMLIQPFAENALKHAFNDRDDQFHLSIYIKKGNEFLWVEIEDNGIGRNDLKSNHHKSVGSNIVEDRLNILRPDMQKSGQLQYIDKKDNEGMGIGTLVRLLVPVYRESFTSI